MKTQFKALFSAAMFLFAGSLACVPLGTAMAQSNAEEVPGDNFSLEGALELFKKSASPQEFEQLLNSPDSKVNNLDLNGDGEIDYIRVTDRTEGNVHAFILSAVVSSNESQDVAVIELEKKRNGEAVLQIVGDADVYGVETIIEPTEEVRVNAGASTARTVVNVWAWPSVQYVYGPSYVVWVSPWRYSYYPMWYRPWRPLAWTIYDPYWAPYRPYYSVCFRHRVAYAPMIYRPYRTTSVVVYNRNYNQINTFRNTSHSYRYDRGDYARGARYNRYDAEHRTRADYSSHNNRSSYSNSVDHNRSNDHGRSTDHNQSVDHTRSTDYNRTDRTRSSSFENHTRTRSDFNRNPVQRESRSSGFSQREFSPPAQRQQPSFQHSPQRSSSPHISSPGGGGSFPGRSGGHGGGGGSHGGGGGGGNGGGHGRRH